MKGKLFGGMKVKGPSAKQEQTKKQSTPVSETSLDSKSQQADVKAPAKSQALQQSTKYIQEKQRTAITKPPQKQQPKVQKKQSQKQISSKQSSSSNVQKQNPVSQQDQQPERQEKVESKKQQTIGRKDFTKSRSEKNYDGQDSEDNNDVREDRSVVVGRQEEKEEIEFKKSYTGKPVGTGPKSNPLLNQIKKISAKPGTQTNKDKQPQATANPAKSPKPIATSIKQQKNQKPKRQKAIIMQQLYSSHSRILQQLLQKHQAKQQIITLTSHVIELKQQLATLTNKQNHYISTEEYELADKLEGKITEVVGKITEEDVEINFVQEEIFRLQLEGVGVLRTHFQEEKRTIRRLKLVELDIQDEITHFARNQDQKLQASRSLSENQKKKYQRIVSDIKNQSEQLQKYQQTFYEDLNSRKSPLESQLHQQQHKRAQLQTQIKQLQEKLKKTKALLKKTVANIQTTKVKIAQVDQTFEEEKQKLDERKKNISQLQNDKNQQHTKLLEIEEHLKLQQKAKNNHITTMTKQKQSYHQLSTSIETFFDSIDVQQYLSNKKQVIEDFMKHSRALKQFQQVHKQKRQQIKQLEFQKSNTLSEITKNQQRIKELKQRIPKLQNEQKQLSLAKNFKGAAMKKSEIKQCTDSVEEIKKQIEEAYASEAELDSKIEQINADQEKFVEEENELRMALALSQFRLAVEKKKQIGRELEWVKELQKGAKGKDVHEARLKEELAELQEEINYIAEEYQLQEEMEQKASKKTAKQLGSGKGLKNQPTPTQIQQSSYTQLSLSQQQQKQTSQQEAEQKSQKSSNQALQGQEANEQHSKQEPNQESHNTQSQEESVYEPLQLELDMEVEEHEGEEEAEEHKDEEEIGYVPLQLD